MADVQSTILQKGKNKPKRKILSTRIDLTPMVDLGFLLITFFVFTTALSQPKAMKLNLPVNEDSSVVSEDKTLNLLLAGQNKVVYYRGNRIQTLQVVSFAASGIRQIIQQQQQMVATKFGDAKQTVVLIKATPDAMYKNIVDVLDEMLINDVRRYVLMDADNQETQAAKQKIITLNK